MNDKTFFRIVFWVGSGLIGLFVAVQEYWRTRLTRIWTPVEGHIESCAIPDAYAEISYSYEVNGQFYAGRYTRREGDTEEYAASHNQGDTIRVFYNPKNPEYSVIDPGPVNFLKITAGGVWCFVVAAKIAGLF